MAEEAQLSAVGFLPIITIRGENGNGKKGNGCDITAGTDLVHARF